MAQAKKRLGRGLGNLITSGGKASAPNATEAAKAAAQAKPQPADKEAEAAARDYLEIPVTKVVPSPYQPRREILEEAIRELADSIRAAGPLQPIVVRKRQTPYELTAGERRRRAFQLHEIKCSPARLIDATDASSAALSLIENLQREGLNPIEEALGYASLMRDFDLTQEATAERMGKSRAAIANALRLLSLDRDIQGYLSKGLLSTGHAKVLLGLKEPEHRLIMAQRIIEMGLSVRETEKQIKRLNEGRKANASKKSSSAAEDAVVQDLERRLTSRLNTRVSLQHNAKKGKIVIEYAGNDDLQRILDRLGVEG